MPVLAPAMQAKPAALPSDRARPTKSVMSGPGVMERIAVAIANWTKIVHSGMKVRFVRNGMRKAPKIRGTLTRIKVRRHWFLSSFL